MLFVAFFAQAAFEGRIYLHIRFLEGLTLLFGVQNLSKLELIFSVVITSLSLSLHANYFEDSAIPQERAYPPMKRRKKPPIPPQMRAFFWPVVIEFVPNPYP